MSNTSGALDGIWDKIPGVGVQPPGFPQKETFVGGAAVWTSVDGTTWTLVSDDEAVFGGTNSQQRSSGTTGGPGQLAFGRALDPAAAQIPV